MVYFRQLFLLFVLSFTSVLHANPLDIATIETAIHDKYIQRYPTLSIASLQVSPLGREPKNFQRFQIEKITISKASLKRNHGTISVLYTYGSKKKKRFFKYTMDGSIGVYLSKYYIKKDHIINENYVEYQEIFFKRFPAQPIDAQYFDDYASKRSIKKGKIITIHDLKRVLDIKRNDILNASLYDGNVQLSFKVKAINEGNVGDVIKVKRGHYKKFQALITSKNTVDILE